MRTYSLRQSRSAIIKYTIVVIVLYSCAGCRLWNPNKIYKVPLSDLSAIETREATKGYKVRPGDQLSVVVHTNNGYKIVDAGLASFSGNQSVGNTIQFTYLVEGNGVARFPMIDTVSIAGLTLVEAAERLEARYKFHLVDPWVQLKVVNRRAFVYRGSEQATVVSLPYEQMTLLEVIASAGGFPANGKAYRIKLVREGPQGPIIYGLDLRDDDNLLAGQTIVQANDVIIIDPTFQSTFVAQLTPFLAVITSGIAVYGLLRSLQP